MIGEFTVYVKFRTCVYNWEWIFTGVYGPTRPLYRESSWEESGAIRGLWDSPWCMGGDFNITRFPGERKGGGNISLSMRRFSEIIEKLELCDNLMQGDLFTWRGETNNQLASRLDRF